jgi:hypothetical protein
MNGLKRRIERIEGALGGLGSIPEAERIQILEECEFPTREALNKREEEIVHRLAEKYRISPEAVEKQITFCVLTDFSRDRESSPEAIKG